MTADSAETRIAHVTDPHLSFGMPRGAELFGKRGLSALSWLSSRRSRHNAETAEVLVQDLLADPHDAVAMTGDLINFGLPREFELSKKWLSRLGPPDSVIAIPGNHEALAGNWEEAMERHWAGYAEPNRTLTLGGANLIAVSSACVTPPLFASGHVQQAALECLRSNLAAARAKGLLAVVLIHHPPTPIAKRRKALSNLRDTADVVANGGASLVLHGHMHGRDLSWIDAPHGRIPVLGAPSLSMAPGHRHPAGAWRSLLIQRSEGATRVRITERVITKSMGLATRTPFDLRLPVVA